MAGAHRVISDQFQELVHIKSFLVSPFHQQSFLKGGRAVTQDLMKPAQTGFRCERKEMQQREGRALGLFPGSYGSASLTLLRASLIFIFPVMSSLFCALCAFQAGDKHYHPSCARCSRCNQMFTEGEEMYLQGEHTCLCCHCHRKLYCLTFGSF